MKSQRNNSFPADGHKAILNKINNNSNGYILFLNSTYTHWVNPE